MAVKLRLSFKDLVSRLGSDLSSVNSQPLLGSISVNSGSDRIGGLDVQRSYAFPNYTCNDQCHYDKEDIPEFEASGLNDAYEYLRVKLLPSLVLEKLDSEGSTSLRVKVRKFVAGKDSLS
jgi:hypothetical protein